MSNINNITDENIPALGLNAAKRTVQGSSDELRQQDFMQLLVAQLSNQSPLEPENPGDFLGQMAQFGTVDGINSLNKTVETLVGSLQSRKALEASVLIGKEVLVQSDQLALVQDKTAKGAVDIGASVQNLKIAVHDAAGQLVKTIHLGDQGAGLKAFEWDGKTDNGNVMDAGSYRFTASATFDGEERALPTLSFGNVDSVTLASNGSYRLNLAGLGQYLYEDIKQLN